MSSDTLPTEQPREPNEISDFLRRMRDPVMPRTTGAAKLVIGIDATASREPTWDSACRLQGEMFEATAGLGGLTVQLVFYRGFDECRASKWVGTPAELHALMRQVKCVGGRTQIARVLRHVIAACERGDKIGALVLVSDAMEEELDHLAPLAREVGRLGTPIFIFQEGTSPRVARGFKQLAELSGGAHASFDLNSADRLKRLLGAVAALVAGGHQALADYHRQYGKILRLTGRTGE